MASRSSVKKSLETLSRSERKDLTRANLLQAALSLMGEGRSFTSLALREIAVGMLPAPDTPTDGVHHLLAAHPWPRGGQERLRERTARSQIPGRLPAARGHQPA